MHLLTSIVVIITLALCNADQYYDRSTFPNIKNSPHSCYISSSDVKINDSQLHFCDPDNIIQSHRYTQLNQRLSDFQKNTHCICSKCNEGQSGIKAYVAIAKNIHLGYGQHDEQVVIDMADYIRKKWLLGECGDDFLIFKAMNDEMIYTSMGFETKKYLSSEFTQEVNQRIARQRKDDVFVMISEILDEYQKKVSDVKAEMSREPEEPSDDTGLIVGAVIGGLVFAALIIILIVVYIKSGKIKEAQLRNARYQTDPEVKIRPTGSVLYSAVNNDDDGNAGMDTKISFEEEEKSEKEKSEKEEATKEKTDSGNEKPKNTTPPPPKPTKDTTPPPPTAPKPTKDTTPPPPTAPKPTKDKTPPPPTAPKPKNTTPPPPEPESTPPPSAPTSEPLPDSSV